MISKLKNKFTESSFGKNATAAGAAALIATMPLAFTSAAHAEDAKTQQVSMQQQEIVVPMNDARGIQKDGVQMSAAIVSKDAQVIVFFGNNYEAYKATVQAAKEVLAEGQIPLRGIILADPLKPKFEGEYQIASSQRIEFYTDAQLTGSIDNPSPSVAKDITAQLRRDYQQIIVPRRSVAAVSPDLAIR